MVDVNPAMAKCLIAFLLAVVGIVTMRTRPHWLEPILRFKYLSPNWITTYRVFLFWAGFVTLSLGDAVHGIMLMTVGVALDFFDGLISKLRDRLNDPEFPGTTAIGKWYDPLADKLTLLVALVINEYGMWPVYVLIAIEVFGTVSREPFLGLYSPRFLQFLRKESSAASAFGKIKFIVEVGLVALSIFCKEGWVSHTYVEMLVWPAIAAAIASVAFKFDLGATLNSVAVKFTELVSHRVENRR